MGYYSQIDECEAEIIDLEGLKTFLNDVKNNKYGFPDDIIELSKELKIKSDHISDHLSFEKWDSIKIIGYYYSEMLSFLDCLATFIEGMISFIAEDNNEKLEIYFDDAEINFEIYEMKSVSYKPKELTKYKIPDEIKQLKTAKKV